MAQDDPVVSPQWLHEHLGMPDVKVKKKKSSSLHVHIQFRDKYFNNASFFEKKGSEILIISPALVVYVENITV